ncbi:ABC transporter substrate-binding protein [Paenibacillus filicis]|uniref:ABC transporter substrate-binding protein n=1 Tax=Paenibacillus filicis TaxID=669464 RepID=A0ABU9DJ93_9BACL
MKGYRKPIRQSMLLSISAAMLAVLAAGCAGGNEPGASQGAGGTAGGDKTTIKILQNKIEITDKVKAMVADYMAQNPNVNVEVQVVKDYNTLIKTRFAAGDAPDIFTTAGYSAMASWSENLLDLSNEPWMQKVSPMTVEGMTFNGQKLGFPMAFEGFGVIYNKDLFAKAGVDKLPTTFSELQQTAEKLKAAGIQPYKEAYQETFPLYHLLNLAFAYEKDPAASLAKLEKGEMKLKDLPHINEVFNVLDLAMKYGSGQESIGVSYDSQVSDFASGKVAMIHNGVWAIDPIQKVNPKVNLGMFALPLSDNAAETKMPISVPGYYVINKNSKNIEESKKFLTWLHTNGQKYLVDSFKFIPAFTDLKTTPELGPLATDMAPYAESGKGIPWTQNAWPVGYKEDSPKRLQAYIGGQTNRDQAIAELQKDWDNRVKK